MRVTTNSLVRMKARIAVSRTSDSVGGSTLDYALEYVYAPVYDCSLASAAFWVSVEDRFLDLVVYFPQDGEIR